jgi:uncharacterized protein YndB with AHSA1/START domain
MTGSEPRHVTVERVIHAAPAAIFDILADPTQHSTLDGSHTVRHPTASLPRRLSQGARFVMRMRVRPEGHHPADLLQVTVAALSRGRLTNTVVEFQEGRRIAWRNFGRHVWRYQLEPTGEPDTTLVRETFDYSTNAFPPLLELVGFPAKNRHAMQATLERLAQLVERDH